MSRRAIQALLLPAVAVLAAAAAPAAPPAAPAAATTVPAAAEAADTAGTAWDGTPPPVVLIIVDTWRADHFGALGNDWIRTPNADSLAADGVLFRRCLAAAPWTLPSVASIYTGLLPYSHGALGGRYGRLPEERTTLGEHLMEAGYRTLAWVTVSWLGAAHGMEQGLMSLNLEPDVGGGRKGPYITDKAMTWVENNHDRPFLLILHYFDPHSPYLPPEQVDRLYYEGDEKAGDEPILPFLLSDANHAGGNKDWMYDWLEGVTDLEFPIRQYAACVTWADRNLGIVIDRLKAIGLYDEALVILTADHGEHLGEHDIWFTHTYPYQEILHVPLVVHFPGGRHAGAEIDTPVSLVDVLPTVLAACGLPQPEGLDGRDLEPLAAGEAFPPRALYAEGGANIARHSKVVVDWPWKLYLSRLGNRFVPQLFDLETDPGELRDVAEREPARVKRLEALVWERFPRANPLLADGKARPAKLDQETRKRLRSLGY